MSQSLRDYVWVFIGCGGTFYATGPYLAVLRKRYLGEGPTILIDPDDVERSNHSRQWPTFSPGSPKVTCAGTVLDCETIAIQAMFNPGDPVLEKETHGKSVLAIVNVDNDDARLDVAEWLESRHDPGIMVVSGCERTFGQCYSGVWMDGEAVHDWRECHPDVGSESEPIRRCNLQDVRANALTGVCTGMCVEDIERRVRSGFWTELLEFYWNADDSGKVRLWQSTVLACRGDNHG
jgi:hypothetical protein